MAKSKTFEPLPEALHGTQAIRVPTGKNKQTTHLVRRGEVDTICGLTRFDEYDPEDGTKVTRAADLPGWSVGGGLSGPGVKQIVCNDCFSS